MIDLAEIGDILRRIRTERNLSLREAAGRIGVSHTYLNALEKGVNPQTGKSVNPSAKTLRKVSEAYGISLDELLSKGDRAETDEERNVEDIADAIRRLRPKDREAILHLIKRLGDR